MTITKTLGMPRGAGGQWLTALGGVSWSVLWRLDGASFTALDSSGNGRNGTINNSSLLSQGKLLWGSADTGSSIRTPASAYGVVVSSAVWMQSSTYSVMAIFKRSSAPAAEAHLVSRDHNSSGSSRHFKLAVNTSGQVLFTAYDSTGAATATVTASALGNLCDDNPHLVIGTFDAATKTATLYVDSTVAIGTASHAATVSNPAAHLYVGARNGSDSFWGGQVAEVGYLVGSVLSTAQIGALVDAFLTAGETDTALVMTPGPPDTIALGLAEETETVFALAKQKTYTPPLLENFDEPLALSSVHPVNGGFANRDDISDEVGYLPTTNLTTANTEAGEHTGGLTATVWWEWTASADYPPNEVTLSFDWAGQSGAGGASLRVYDPTTLDALPGSGEIVAQDNELGAAGTASVSFTPVAGTTYYIQQGIVEKAGTQTHLLLSLDYASAPSFTPVIP